MKGRREEGVVDTPRVAEERREVKSEERDVSHNDELCDVIEEEGVAGDGGGSGATVVGNSEGVCPAMRVKDGVLGAKRDVGAEEVDGEVDRLVD